MSQTLMWKLDGIISILSGAGVFLFAFFLWNSHASTSQEKKLLRVLVTTCLLLLVRGVYWATNIKFFAILIFVFASLLPLLIMMYVESLLRRHFPLYAKWFAFLGAFLFFCINLFSPIMFDPSKIYAFSAYVFLLQLIVVFEIFRRDVFDLSNFENRILRSTVSGVILVAPLFFTDLLSDAGFEIPRLGSLGALVLIYSWIRFTNIVSGKQNVLFEIFKIVFFGFVFGWSSSLLWKDETFYTLVYASSFFMVLLFSTQIYFKIQALTLKNSESKFLGHLLKSDDYDVNSFIRSLEVSGTLDQVIFLESKLFSELQKKSIHSVFDSFDTKVLSEVELRNFLESTTESSALDHEYVLNLIESSKSSHLVFISDEPWVLIALSHATAGFFKRAKLELGLVQKIAYFLSHSKEKL